MTWHSLRILTSNSDLQLVLCQFHNAVGRPMPSNIVYLVHLVWMKLVSNSLILNIDRWDDVQQYGIFLFYSLSLHCYRIQPSGLVYCFYTVHVSQILVDLVLQNSLHTSLYHETVLFQSHLYFTTLKCYIYFSFWTYTDVIHVFTHLWIWP